MTDTAPDKHWEEALEAAALLATDPAGLGGALIRASAGPLRDRWLESLRGLLPTEAPWRRLPLNTPDGRLLGGLDLAATLAAGRPVAERGLLAEADGGVVIAAMAERLEPGAAARLAAVMDSGAVSLERDGLALSTSTRFALVALDEGLAPEERPPAALAERLAFHLELESLPARLCPSAGIEAARIAAARARLPEVATDAEALEALCAAALALGIDSLRAPLLALRAARAAAALAGRACTDAGDVALAARLVLAPRATRLPAAETQEPEPAPPEPQAESESDSAGEPERNDGPLEEQVLEAALAAIPPGLLAQLKPEGGGRGPASSGKAGALKLSSLRGRPIGSRRGAPGGGARLNVIETLRAAAPWQPLRRTQGSEKRIQVRRDDFRVTRFKQRSETTTLFVVDASGSAALHRLAEVKGAVELLLADSYARRDRVSLIAFRGAGAELLLPPTRSLVLAKRRLAALPGGGGTPLASGIAAALTLAGDLARRGQTPLVVLLTDGRANIARDGSPGRERAEAESLQAARAFAEGGIAALLVDAAPRPQPRAEALARAMRAIYLPLPIADAAALSRGVRAAAPAA